MNFKPKNNILNYRFILLLFFSSYSASQNEAYTGGISFNYSGTVNNYFSSLSEDSISTSIAFNQDNGDSSFFLFAAITQQEINDFDLFLGVLRDTTFPVESRSWEIPGEGDENNPLSLETIIVLIPELDSSFVLNFLDTFSDTSENQDSSDIFTEIFTTLSNQLYLGLQGNLEIEVSNDGSIVGNFSSILFKPAFHIPPHLITINDGEFFFNRVVTPSLNLVKSKSTANDYSLFKTYPNPFNPIIQFQFEVDLKSDVSLEIFDIQGKKIKTIYQGNIDSGEHLFRWDAKNVSTGIYFSVLKSKSFFITKKITLNK